MILLHQVLDGYVTLFQVYEHVINPDKLAQRIVEGDERFRRFDKRIVIDKSEHMKEAVAGLTWHPTDDELETWTRWAPELEAVLNAGRVQFRIQEPELTAVDRDRRAQFEAVKRWFEDDWRRIEPKLRTSIVEGISVFLSLFDDNPRVKYTFCPPKTLYETQPTSDSKHGIALPPIGDLIEQGKVIALNFPTATNPGLARAIGTMLKQDFQRAVLSRIPHMNVEHDRTWRPVVFLCDEYQAFATVGEHEPSGDEKFFSLARQAAAFRLSRHRA